MTEFFRPDNAQAAAELITQAAEKKRPLALQGGGTKSAIGSPMQVDAIISSSNLSGITLYEPTELVIAARAGTPIVEIEAALAKHNQRLSFDVPSYQNLLNSQGTPTIGAIAATNLSGPRRIAFGAARDSLIGIEMINGRGEIVKNGGRVMKNVTGYDLTKLICGSWGTLGLLTEVCFKLQPCPQGEKTLVFKGLADEKAISLLCMALGSPFEITSAAHIPARAGIEAGEASRTLIRIEGFDASLTYRSEELQDLLTEFGEAEILSGSASQHQWHAIGELTALDVKDDEMVWKISVKPTDGPSIGRYLSEEMQARLLYDWSGGLVWAAMPQQAQDQSIAASKLRAKVTELGGHATLIKAPQDLRKQIASFHPQNAALQKLTQAAKTSFDPMGIFNPALMFGQKGA